ncbi:anti-sigma factor domain-containing protein [Mitsuaria sp. 7]|uniref:anti-sigma factor n=1 Tax=Mitsuaria sp. 7 TaxID=1658665 RepID=UPI000835DB23|nr:anti-sigma factor [Mitsuaria sp. 7]
MNYNRPELLEHLSREYVLGTLQGPARRRFVTLMRDSRPIALAVAQWEQRIAVMERTPVLIQPPVTTWQGIEQRLFPRAQESKQASKQTSKQPRPSGGLSAVLGWLTGRAAGGVLAGLLLAVVLVKTVPTTVGLEPASEALPASYVGVLSAQDSPPSVVVSSKRHGKLLTVKVLRPIAVPEGRRATLWAVPKDGAPFVVGTVSPSGQTQIALPAESEKLFFSVGRVAISLEASDGPAPATPSAFVLEGACVKVW